MTTRAEILDSFLDDIVEKVMDYGIGMADDTLKYDLDFEVDQEGDVIYYIEVKGVQYWEKETTLGDCYLIPDETEFYMWSQRVYKCEITKYVGDEEEWTFDITDEVDRALDKLVGISY